MAIKVITELGDRIYLSTGYFNKELETIKKTKSKIYIYSEVLNHITQLYVPNKLPVFIV